MLFRLTTAGSFVDAVTIVAARRACSWVAICNGDRRCLAGLHSSPARLKELQHLLPPQARHSRRRKGRCDCASEDIVAGAFDAAGDLLR
jgi:hypothetical protein